MKADAILRLHAERCSPVEIALALRMDTYHVRKVIAHGWWPRQRRMTKGAVALRMLAAMRA
jgi:hypothetical protein